MASTRTDVEGSLRRLGTHRADLPVLPDAMDAPERLRPVQQRQRAQARHDGRNRGGSDLGAPGRQGRPGAAAGREGTAWPPRCRLGRHRESLSTYGVVRPVDRPSWAERPSRHSRPVYTVEPPRPECPTCFASHTASACPRSRSCACCPSGCPLRHDPGRLADHGRNPDRGLLVESAGDVGLPGRAGGRRGHQQADRHGKDAGAHRRI